MALSKENIQFIDTYLKNSGVDYIDIRYEMMDHIASAVEAKMEEEQEIFRYAFKSYMLQNKKEFLKNNKKYLSLASTKALRMLIGNLVKPLFAGLTFLVYGFFFATTKLFPGFQYDTVFEFMSFILIVTLSGTLLYKNFAKGEKFSVADKLLGMYCILNYFPYSLFRLQDKIKDTNLLFGYYAIMLSLALATFFTYRELIKNYKDKYQMA